MLPIINSAKIHIPTSVLCNDSPMECAGALITNFMPWKLHFLGGSLSVRGVTAGSNSDDMKADIEKIMA